jgi:hypothetical protein
MAVKPKQTGGLTKKQEAREAVCDGGEADAKLAPGDQSLM